MASDANQPDWFKQFKKLNEATKAVETPSPVPPPPPLPAPPSSGPPTPSSSPAGPGPRGTERRRHPRFEVDGARIVVYREGLLTLVGLGKENKGRVAIDVSEGGLQVVSRERLPIGAKVKFHLEFERFKDAIEGVGQVRWCYQNALRRSDFHVGIQFIDLPPAEVRKIGSMREYFTSAHVRAMIETRKRQRSDSDKLDTPK